jgi:pre-rRNA-processing protein TSR3
LRPLRRRFASVVLFMLSRAHVGHSEWAEQILSGFSWGHAFFEVNGTLLEKYAKCSSAEEVNEVQEAWLTRLEQEWMESRESKLEQDDWAGGNPNRLANRTAEESDSDDDSDDEEKEDEGEDEDEEEGDDQIEENKQQTVNQGIVNADGS